MIVRPYYLDILKTYRDVPLVKVLAGIRRCGKSTILDMLKDDLLGSGIAADHVIHLRYTSEELDDSMTAKQMYRDIKEKMTDGERYYLLLDEVQEVDGWEKAVNSLLEDANTDIYVTGSNSKLMSSEISTYLTGRYISIPVYTLSFAEYLDFKKPDSRSPKELLNEYLRLGGFPIVALGSFDERSAYQIVEGIYNSVITNDITKRHNIMNFDLFNRVVKYIVENVGKTFSANAIAKFLKSEGRSLSVEAVYNYLNWLEKAFVIYRCQRYDLQGKSVLKTQEKFYLADASLKYCIMGFNPKSIAAMLENIVYPPRQRGYYRDGHQDAVQRYLRRMAINQNDMMMYEKIVDEEIRKYYQQNTRQRSNKYDEGYYDGLKLVARALKQSRDLMMEEISDRLAAALKVY